MSVFFNFKGVTSHAAAAPELGRSALDAAELMSVGVNYLREHIISDARIHYAYRDVGGIAPMWYKGHSRPTTLSALPSPGRFRRSISGSLMWPRELQR